MGKAIRDIRLVYIGLRTKIYSAAFQCVNLSVYIVKVVILQLECIAFSSVRYQQREEKQPLVYMMYIYSILNLQNIYKPTFNDG